ncbi:MAG TPA: response regulator [Candidatus Cloacimonadota bacterium]|nr:response regulator [Candidatus Cloacimonadota bacterium]
MNHTHKVLIVEDETIVALSLKTELESYGFSVLEPVASGEKAIAIIRHECPSLILLDIRLSGDLTGLDVARTPMSHAHSGLIIFMTGYITPAIKAEALKLNPVAFLEKPVDICDILTALGH